MNLTTYFKDNLFDLIFGGVAYSIPTTYYLGLLTNPTFVDGDTPVEPVGFGYSRVGIANDKVTFSVSSSGMIDNLIQIEFPAAVGGDWATTPFLALYDTSSGGNLLAWADVDALTGNSVTVADGKKLTIKAGSLTIT